MSEEAKLRWRCRRGMREMDLLLGGYLDTYYGDAPAPTQAAFQAMLEELDQDIYDWVMERRPCPAAYTDIIRELQQLTACRQPQSN